MHDEPMFLCFNKDGSKNSFYYSLKIVQLNNYNIFNFFYI